MSVISEQTMREQIRDVLKLEGVHGVTSRTGFAELQADESDWERYEALWQDECRKLAGEVKPSMEPEEPDRLLTGLPAIAETLDRMVSEQAGAVESQKEMAAKLNALAKPKE